MSRYRTPLGPRDDQDDLAGDATFTGVNMVDSPETLGPGYVREAVNHDFTRRSGDPRGGFVCLPQLAPGGVGTLYGEAVYVDIDTRLEWQALMLQTSMVFFRQGSPLRTIAFPAGYTAGVEICSLVQAQNRFYIFQRGATPVVWNGDWSAAFVNVARTAYDVFKQIPNAFFGLYFQDRLWLPFDKDNFAVSLLSDFQLTDATTGSFSVNSGAGDELVTIIPFGKQSMIIGKTRSITKLLGVTASLTNLVKDEVTRSHGFIAARAVVQAGNRLYYLSSDRALRALDLTMELDVAPVAEPVSAPIRPWMERINWAVAWRSIMHHDEERLFLAVPMDGASAPNKIIVYNLVRQEFDGLWEFAAGFSPFFRGFARLDVYGQRRLCALTIEGRAFLLDEGEADVRGANVWPIVSTLKTRGYMPNPRWSRGVLGEVQLGTLAPSVTVSVETDGVAESTTIATGQTWDRTRSHYFGGVSDHLNSLGLAGAPGREDYAVVPGESDPAGILIDEGVDLGLQQAHKLTRPLRTQGRWHGFTIVNTTGIAAVRQVGLLAREADRAGRQPI